MIHRVLFRQRAALRSYTYGISIKPLPERLLQPNSSSLCAQSRSLKWYSSTPEVKETKDEVEQETSTIGTEEIDPVQKEIADKKREIIDLKDKYLRSVAEFQNLQHRTKRDMLAAKNFAIQNFAKDLIESVDNLDRALTMIPSEKLLDIEGSEDRKDLRMLHEGLKMTESVLMNTLKKHGLERFDPSIDGEKFNPFEHEATFMVPMEGKENDTVFNTQQKGFKLNGRVLRAAKVGVVKNP